MSQRELADLIGTRQSVVARLEDADYRGHSLSMLQRIGNALGQRLELRFVRTGRKNPKPAGEASGSPHPSARLSSAPTISEGASRFRFNRRKEALPRACQQPVDRPLIAMRSPDKPVVASAQTLHIEFLSRLNSIHAPQLRWQDHSPLR